MPQGHASQRRVSTVGPMVERGPQVRQTVPSMGRNIPNAKQTLRSAASKHRTEASVDGLLTRRVPGTNLAP